MAEGTVINVRRLTRVVADVLGYLDYMKEEEDADISAIEATQALLITAYIRKVHEDSRVVPF